MRIGLHRSWNFLRPWENRSRLGESLSFSLEQAHILSSRLPRQILQRQSNWGKVVGRPLPNHSAKTTQSPTTERPQHLSAEPPVFLDFFNITPLPPVSFHWVGILHFFRQSSTQYLSHGWNFSVSFNWGPPVSRPWVGLFLMFHLAPTTPVSFHLGGGCNLLHFQIKPRLSASIEDSRARRDLPKLICTPGGGGWCKWPLLVPKLWLLVVFRRRKEVHSGLLIYNLKVLELTFIWGKMRTAAWEQHLR